MAANYFLIILLVKLALLFDPLGSLVAVLAWSFVHHLIIFAARAFPFVILAILESLGISLLIAMCCKRPFESFLALLITIILSLFR